MVDTRKFAEIALTVRARNGFLKRVRRAGTDECWPFQGKLSSKGYGVVKSGAHDYVSSRVVWFLEHGQPNGVVCHRCDNPACCNPRHLFVASQSANLLDMVAKGRCPNGSKTHCKRGHEYTPENTAFVQTAHRRQHRRCLACRRAADRLRPLIPLDIIAEIRHLRGQLSQREIAKKFGVSPGSVSRLQNSDYDPRQSRYWRLASPLPTIERLTRELLR